MPAAPAGTARLPVRRPFSFWATARSHGWAALAPYRWDDATQALERIDRLPNGRVSRLRLTAGPALNTRTTTVRLDIDPPPPDADRVQLERRARRLLHLDADLRPFHTLCRLDPALRLIPKLGAGRLLRAPDLWEDIVKGICTTNITWQRTVRMTQALTDLGDPLNGDDEARAFPTPLQVLAAGPAYLTEHAGMGYRAPYVLRLAEQVAAERLDLAALVRDTPEGRERRAALQHLPGIGPVTAAYVAMLTGSYDALTLDSATLAFARRELFRGRAVRPATVERRFRRHGAWRGLAFWFTYWQTWSSVRAWRQKAAT